MPALAVRTRVLEGFDDPTFGAEQWDELLRRGATDTIYLTWHWQRAWWDALGQGDLLLIVAERDGRVVALAPFYSRWHMVSFLGSEIEADCLDFVGDSTDPEVLDALLATACASVPRFKGFDLRQVPDQSGTGKRLQEAATRLELSCCDEWGRGAPAPVLDLVDHADVAATVANGQRVLKNERFFQRDGSFTVSHLRDGEAILPHLDQFFEQHIARRALTPHPSPFVDPAQRVFYERFTRLAADTGRLRFTRIDWQQRPIAFHFGYCHRGRYYWDRPSFAVDLARRSPGKILLRHLLLAAMAEGAHTFDFGVGDETFKDEFSTHAEYVRLWKIFPK